MKITICKAYKKSKYDNTCKNCNSNKSYCDYTRTYQYLEVMTLKNKTKNLINKNINK